MVEGVKDYAIFMLDTEGRVSSWNAGASASKVIGQRRFLANTFSGILPPGRRSRRRSPATGLADRR